MSALPQDVSYFRQPQSVGVNLWTFGDLCERVMLFANAGPTSTQFPEYVSAAERAYRFVTESKKWRYLVKQLEIATNEPLNSEGIQLNVWSLTWSTDQGAYQFNLNDGLNGAVYQIIDSLTAAQVQALIPNCTVTDVHGGSGLTKPYYIYFTDDNEHKLTVSSDTGASASVTETTPYSLIGATISYNNATRQVTLSAGVWPTWIQYGHLRFDEVFFPIEKVLSTTTVRLSQYCNPGRDFAAGQCFVANRSVYFLPVDFRWTGSPETQLLFWRGRYVDPRTWYAMERHLGVSSIPFMWTVFPEPTQLGRFAIAFYPSPVGDLNGTMYIANPRQLRVSGYSIADFSGTCSVSGSTVTGSGTSWGQQHVGCLMRFSSVAGQYPSGTSGPNVFAEQAVVVSVNSATSITLDRTLAGTYGSSTYYRISDPLDISVTLIEAVNAHAEFYYMRGRPSTNAPLAAYERFAHAAYIKACENEPIQLGGDMGPEVVDWFQRDVPPPYGNGPS